MRTSSVHDHRRGRRGGLAYDVHGPDDAPVLVLGSSLGTTRHMWEPQLRTFCESFRVVRYDHLGHGSSAVPPGPYTLDQLTAELVALLDELQVDRAHLAGLSLGGMLALHCAATLPERVERLAVVCSSAHMPPADAWYERASMVRARGTDAALPAARSRWFTPAFSSTSQANTLYTQLLETPAEGYAGCCAAIATMDLRPLLPRIAAPTLVIAGAEDPATPVDHARTISEGIANAGTPARLEVVEGAAHLASVERPDRVGQLILDHLRSEPN
ncbi:3-oxoadipate enol-lactonase [Actinobacteria bacterium YIM 96077]|uniref:3-oxoadipate enol-lactonase n=1 Tax=Phytoactinopolyspora halophila TaxID=1981511 RepID=A0A329QP44_9ACTN|nr:3-oxoadipate enol-lactonase [Phytoactinopolyspora halophila]AYY14600.1 3-oxoadipate enol-lactonase [Actinobacteria bacterium YIM 96077]RAW14023.1 3-oxoadipate enol-lactonase [Phytoactinopolyspora halophila]